MKRQWHIQRQVGPQPDAQARWDKAYQLLLRWNETSNIEHDRQNSSRPDSEY